MLLLFTIIAIVAYKMSLPYQPQRKALKANAKSYDQIEELR